MPASSAAARTVAVPRIPLNNGVEFPLISLGTGGYNSSVAKEAFSLALQLNWTSVDTALDYGNQPGLAEAIAESGAARRDVFVLSKVPGCGDAPIRPQTAQGCQNATAAALRADLAALRLGFVDAMLLHSPPTGEVSGCSTAEACALVQAQWRAMEEFYRQGRARAIGVSNYCEACLDCLSQVQGSVVPALNQLQYHAGMGPGPTRSLLARCKRSGIVVQAYAPLGGSASVHPGAPYPLITDPTLAAIGQRSGNRSAAQVALRWIVDTGCTFTTQTQKRSHFEEDLDIFGFQLTADEVARLASL